MNKTIFCLANDNVQADRIVSRLLEMGFSREDISVVFPDKNQEMLTDKEGLVGRNWRNESLATEEHTKAPEGGVTGATLGGIIGGSIGLLAGLGALAIPGLGPFIAAGPLMGALSGSGLGGGLGLLIGSLIGAGIPEYEAKKFEEGLKAGNTLVSVNTHNENEVQRANDIMLNEGAKDISISREKITL